jgi:tau tubulin kinase
VTLYSLQFIERQILRHLPERQPRSAERPGPVVGRWQLTGMLGEGRFGSVFAAVDRGDGTLVALKLAKPGRHRAQEESVLDAIRGCQGVSRMITAAGPENRRILVLELCGPSLRERMRGARGKRLSIDHAGRIGSALVESLESIHRRGVVHCDVKPANVLLPRAGAEGPDCVLSDFGLAQRFDPDFGAVSEKPKFRGTPVYASPHVHRRKPYGRRDDLWSLLFMLIRATVGALPWSREPSRARIGALKSKALDGTLTAGLPAPFTAVLESLRSLDARTVPDYTAIRDAFRQLAGHAAIDDMAVAWLAPRRESDPEPSPKQLPKLPRLRV